MKKLLFIILFFSLLVLVWLIARQNKTLRLETLHLGTRVLHVEVARGSAALSKGLGDRDAIGSDGMLFVLPMRDIPHFWMKDMRFGLDFVWIDQGKVIAVLPNIKSAQGVPDSQLEIYTPGMPTTHVLELPMGDISKRGIHIGDSVLLGK